jgi:hypothetical protein
VRTDWLPRAVVAGFIAAVVMLFAFMLAYALAYLIAGLPPGPAGSPARGLQAWFTGLIHNPATDLAGANLYLVVGLHLLVAIAGATLYATMAEPRLAGAGWRRGVTFSLVLWLLSILVILPLTGGGFLGFDLGAGPLPILGNLILHLIYGATLGTLYGPLGDIPADSLSRTGVADDFATMRGIEGWIAKGVIAGLLVGLLVGLGLTLVSQPDRSSLIVGVPRDAFVLVGALLGAAFGAFVGSFAGLSARHSAD